MLGKPQINISDITVTIIAGGQGSRVGGVDKGLITIKGHHIVSHILEQVSLQSDRILINANRNLEQYKLTGIPVVSDSLPDFPGPLAGILTTLETVSTDYIITLPCDSPVVPDHYLSRMQYTLNQSTAEIAVAFDGERRQQMYAMIPSTLTNDLRHFLVGGGRAIKRWFALHQLVEVDFSDQTSAFHNINTPNDLASFNSA